VATGVGTLTATRPASRSRAKATVQPFEYRPALDGLRAVAVLLVILFHARTPNFAHGYVGVDVFFVLSGFLITSLLARELLGTGRLRFVAFYARRVRRLLPAALFVLLVTATAYQLTASPAAVAENRGGFIAAALYYANWFFLSQSQDYFAEDAHPSPVQHYWSLSVEEQFYLVWPALVLGLVVLWRRYRFRLDVAAGALAIAGLTYAGILAAGNPMASYLGTPARAYQLLIGATIALACLRHERLARGRHPVSRPPGVALAAGGLALVVFAGTPLLGTGSAYWHGVAAALGTGALILGLELRTTSAPARLLSWRPARLLGRWSYSAYLWHWPVVIVGDEVGALPDAWAPRTLIVALVTVSLSAATFSLIERPTQRISLRTFPRQRLIAVTGLVGALAAALLFQPILRVDGRTAALLDDAAAGSGTLVSVGDAGSSKSTVLLVGDSHAMVLYPALERLASWEGWSLVPVAEIACPWPRVTATDDGVPLDCETMRQDALREAARKKPDLALLVSRSLMVRPLEVDGRLVAPGAPGWLEEVQRGTEDFLAELRPLVGRVVIVEPLPETSEPMVYCLSTGADPASCAAPLVHLPGSDDLSSYWRSLPEVTAVSLDDLICPGGICPAMVDGIPTHRDTNHLTPKFSRLIAYPFDDYLSDRGIFLDRGRVAAG
jgi:peptidoglycan/LPS O-acetylase OafA/YrhL